MKLSEKIQTLRKQAGLSQEQLAERLNVTRQAVSRWETGEGKPDIDNLLPLARLLHTTVDYLLEEKDDAQPQMPQERDWWSQIKALFHRYGFIGGYLLAAYGVVRTISAVIMLLTAGSLLGGGLIFDVGFSIAGFTVPYLLLCLLNLVIGIVLIAAGLWLARRLRRKTE